MGLREINAERTRQLIVQGAMELFFDRGFDATTMEEVAQHVGISASTLYRYFPTKEQLGTVLLGDAQLMADRVREHPEGEPLERSLAEALLALVDHAVGTDTELDAFTRMINDNPRLQLRLFDWLMEARDHLCVAVAERLGTEPDDLAAAATSWMTVFALLHTNDPDRTPPPDRRAAVLETLRSLSDAKIVLPRP